MPSLKQIRNRYSPPGNFSCSGDYYFRRRYFLGDIEARPPFHLRRSFFHTTNTSTLSCSPVTYLKSRKVKYTSPSAFLIIIASRIPHCVLKISPTLAR